MSVTYVLYPQQFFFCFVCFPVLILLPSVMYTKLFVVFFLFFSVVQLCFIISDGSMMVLDSLSCFSACMRSRWAFFWSSLSPESDAVNGLLSSTTGDEGGGCASSAASASCCLATNLRAKLLDDNISSL